jgi:hypothetical protein
MANLQLKEELISKIQADPRIWKAVDIRYEEYPQVQKKAVKAYEEILQRLCSRAREVDLLFFTYTDGIYTM